MDTLGQFTTVGTGLVVLIAAVAGWFRYGRSFFRSLDRAFENVNGRPAEFDRAGREIRPAVPSLQAQVADIKTVVSDQAAQNERLAALETHGALVDERLVALERGHALERVAGHIDSAQAWRAVEEIAKNGDQS